MEITKTQRISIKVAALFIVAIFSTFIGDYCHDFLGDWYCNGSGKTIEKGFYYSNCNYGNGGYHDATYHWGYRHWLYFVMCLTLFIIQIVDIINSIDN